MKPGISYIDPEYRANIIFAIAQYQIIKPRHRQTDVDQCLLIASDESYKKHSELINALRSYLALMPTGLRLFRSKSARIKTGNSLLKTLIEEALQTKTIEKLLAYETKLSGDLEKLDQGESKEALLLKNKELFSSLLLAQKKQQEAEEKIRELKTENQNLLIEQTNLQKKLLDSMHQRENIIIGNMELNNSLLLLIEEKKHLVAENTCLRLSSSQSFSDTSNQSKSVAFFEPVTIGPKLNNF